MFQLWRPTLDGIRVMNSKITFKIFNFTTLLNLSFGQLTLRYNKINLSGQPKSRNIFPRLEFNGISPVTSKKALTIFFTRCLPLLHHLFFEQYQEKYYPARYLQNLIWYISALYFFNMAKMGWIIFNYY
jgi:hypothetical protein